MKRLKRAPAAAYDDLLVDIADAIEQARSAVARSVNSVMTTTYWFVGLRIVQHEQRGAERAAYGERVLKRLARDLSERFGRGFFRTESRANASLPSRLADAADKACETVAVVRAAAREINFADSVCELNAIPVDVAHIASRSPGRITRDFWRSETRPPEPSTKARRCVAVGRFGS